MNPRVKTVIATDSHKLEITFSNGEVGVYDCGPLLDFGVFKELRDINYFKRARAESGTVVWPHEQDICPDTLYEDCEKLIPKWASNYRDGGSAIRAARRKPADIRSEPRP